MKMRLRIDSLFGHTASNRRQRRRAGWSQSRFPLEKLEQRIVPATTAFANGTLTIVAQNAEAIAVTVSGGNVAVNGTATAFPAATVATLVVNGDDGANTLNVSGVLEANFPALFDVHLVGGKGADTIVGSPFDDTIIWNNGDGSDLIDGAAGQDELVVNGSATGGDAFTVAAAAGRLSFQRTNLVPFTLNTGTVEDLRISSGGGDDTVTVGNTTGSGLDGVTVFGGEGNDSVDLTGINLDALRLLSLDGEAGNDVVIVSAGNDAANGSPDAFVLSLVSTLDGPEAEFSVNGSTLFASADETARVQVNGSTDADTLTIVGDADLGVPLPTNGLLFNAGSANDSLVIAGVIEATAFNFTNATAGSAQIDLSTVEFTGLELVSDTSTATSRTVFFGPNSDTVTVSDFGTATDGVVQVASASSPTTQVTQAEGGALSINVGAGNDSVTVAALDNTFGGDLFLDGDSGNDTITIASQANVTGLIDLSADGGDGDDLLNAAAFGQTAVLFGGAGNDVLRGGAGHDQLFGDDGNDTFSGGAGNDLIRGGTGLDLLFEEADVDFTLTAQRLVGLGTDNIRVDLAALTGGEGDNIIDASGFIGSVTLRAGGGNDEVIGSPFVDILFGGLGNDTVSGNAGNDVLRGEVGDDSLIGGTGNDRMIGGTGNDDFLWANGDNSDVITGDAGSDVLTVVGSTTAGDVFTLSANGTQARFQRTNLVAFTLDISGVEGLTAEGDGGDDSFTINSLAGVTNLADLSFGGGAGNDTLNASATAAPVGAFGDAGNDSLTGGSGSDELNGGDGDDQIVGAAGNDSLSGDGGIDNLNGGADNDVLSGGAGNDALNGNAGIDQVFEEFDGNLTLSNSQLLGTGTDSLVSIEEAELTGGDSNNNFNASAFSGPVTLVGLGGNDTLVGGSANDRIRGGEGHDSITGNAGDDLMNGGNGDDTIFGGDGNDGLSGLAGNDVLIGNAGDDTLFGGTGNDALLGGAGNDTCLGREGNDTITGGGSTDILAGGSGSGADAGDVFRDAMAGEINEAFSFAVLPSWINLA